MKRIFSGNYLVTSIGGRGVGRFIQTFVDYSRYYKKIFSRSTRMLNEFFSQ